MSNQIVTPAQVEKRLYDLSKDIDEVQRQLEIIEKTYYETKASYEIALAKTRMSYASKSAPNGKNYTVQEREDIALIENEDLHWQLASVEATVRAIRGKAQAVRQQVDVARSIGTSVRAAVDIS
jgi:hypothetical protein